MPIILPSVQFTLHLLRWLKTYELCLAPPDCLSATLCQLTEMQYPLCGCCLRMGITKYHGALHICRVTFKTINSR